MAATFDILYRTERSFFAVDKFHVVDVDIELSAPSHPPFCLGFRDGCKGQSSLRNHERTVHGNVIKNLEVNRVPNMCITDEIVRFKRSLTGVSSSSTSPLELKCGPFRQAEAADDCDAHRLERRAVDGVAPCVAEGVGRGCRKRRRIEPFNGGARP